MMSTFPLGTTISIGGGKEAYFVTIGLDVEGQPSLKWSTNKEIQKDDVGFGLQLPKAADKSLRHFTSSCDDDTYRRIRIN